VNDGEITALLDRLVGSLDGEVGDWDDVLERSAKPVRVAEQGPIHRRRRPWHSSRGLLLIGAAAVVTTLVVLIVESPWRGSPTILDRAAAAVLTASPGQILYESIAIHPSGSSSQGDVTHVHVWVDGASPHRFRVRFDGSRPADVGGRLGGVTGLSYAFSDDVLDPVAFQFPVSQSALDPAAFIRTALISGRAQVDGRTTIRGREVTRIRVSWRAFGRLVPIALYFVDVHTYRPVRVVITAARPSAYRLGFPLTSITFLPYGGFSGAKGPPLRALVYDFLEYRYLAATDANRKLTSVRAAHPRAKIV